MAKTKIGYKVVDKYGGSLLINMGYCINCNDPIRTPVKFTDFVKRGKLCDKITVIGSCGTKEHIKPKFIVSYAEFITTANGEML